ncbi:DUF6575 domain-containing protein [Deinococcus soli (ex Cha et al. 2016)]|uniref:Uncharacterized protein n=2 Tax=Deinococcus soli (ex Cha et al. 2016) TaxID=1309411 RepID=A0ACC6KKT3_9DEIO|nr:DUF6575 domain-containing protein [Deinococcus soli (ex Cha et al. 2016)]MDR6218648.1 hypothetical protein [Deinococcus soli (ex Cha et al. 2016)]MDR6328445.1 hypothetical protein [Deinococcus soli (ex Cha et al. 2016)]MDR6753056.1 hypothetical protein [Deinococcus soli (ex Cha et al. 2016)]
MTGTPVPGVGTLTITRTYLTVNEPTLFSATNELGDAYFVSYADITDHGEAWILTRVSPNRLTRYESGLIDTRDMFLQAETGTVTYAAFNDTTGQTDTRALHPGDEELLTYLAAPGARVPTPLPTPERPRTLNTYRYEIHVTDTRDPDELLYRVVVPNPEWSTGTLHLVHGTLAAGYQATLRTTEITTTERLIETRAATDPADDE